MVALGMAIIVGNILGGPILLKAALADDAKAEGEDGKHEGPRPGPGPEVQGT
jgi:hypothetical protein